MDPSGTDINDDIRDFAARALAEDIGSGDLTSSCVVAEGARLAAQLCAREPMVVAGLGVAAEIFHQVDRDVRFESCTDDGDQIAADTILAKVEGPAAALLTAERTALNALQHLSGIATLTRAYVDEIAGTGAVLLDTRKTIPGLRRLAKYATRLGGAENHRFGLYDAVLIKDNHVALAGGIGAAIEAVRAKGIKDIEIECDTLDQVKEALASGATWLLLDNMDLDTLKGAVALARGKAKLEASGGVTLETIRAIALTGVDHISVGRITQSAPAVDIGMDVSEA